MRKIREAIEAKDSEGSAKMLPALFKAIDTSVKKRSIKKNTGSRYKSRLSRQVALLNPPKAK
jgi:small subunit ribosomal protein S20